MVRYLLQRVIYCKKQQASSWLTCHSEERLSVESKMVGVMKYNSPGIFNDSVYALLLLNRNFQKNTKFNNKY